MREEYDHWSIRPLASSEEIASLFAEKPILACKSVNYMPLSYAEIDGFCEDFYYEAKDNNWITSVIS